MAKLTVITIALVAVSISAMLNALVTIRINREIARIEKQLQQLEQ